MIPFPDQADVMDNKLRPAMRKYKNILLQCPTGWGKTFLSIWMISSAVQKGKKVIFTVPRKELLKQTTLGFQEYGLAHGYIAAGYDHNPYSSAYIGMIDTMARRIDDGKLPYADLVIVDETHYGATSLDAVIRHYQSRGSWVIGLSATPWKLSGQGLGCWYDHMVCGPSIRWLIDNNRLSDYKLYAPSTPDLSGIKTVAGDYARGQLSDKMEADRKLIGDAVRHYKERANGMLNLAFCTSIKHSEIVAQSFKDNGVPAAHIDGTMNDNERRKIIRAFATREIKVLTNCDLCTFGFDLSLQSGLDVTVECCSDLRPTKSLALQAQKWGRVLRKKDRPAIILDHANNWSEFGYPCDEREWSLEDREKRKNSAPTGLASWQCPNCFFVCRPVDKCPECGHVRQINSREIEHVDGELQEIQRIEARKTQGRAQSLDDLIALGRSRGYRYPAKWAARVLAGRMQGKR